MQHQRLKTIVSKGLELSDCSLENQQSEWGLAAVRSLLGRAAGQQCAFARVPQEPPGATLLEGTCLLGGHGSFPVTFSDHRSCVLAEEKREGQRDQRGPKARPPRCGHCLGPCRWPPRMSTRGKGPAGPSCLGEGQTRLQLGCTRHSLPIDRGPGTPGGRCCPPLTSSEQRGEGARCWQWGPALCPSGSRWAEGELCGFPRKPWIR